MNKVSQNKTIVEKILNDILEMLDEWEQPQNNDIVNDEYIVHFGNRSWREACKDCLDRDNVDYRILEDNGTTVKIEILEDMPRCMIDSKYFCFDTDRDTERDTYLSICQDV